MGFARARASVFSAQEPRQAFCRGQVAHLHVVHKRRVSTRVQIVRLGHRVFADHVWVDARSRLRYRLVHRLIRCRRTLYTRFGVSWRVARRAETSSLGGGGVLSVRRGRDTARRGRNSAGHGHATRRRYRPAWPTRSDGPNYRNRWTFAIEARTRPRRAGRRSSRWISNTAACTKR